MCLDKYIIVPDTKMDRLSDISITMIYLPSGNMLNIQLATTYSYIYFNSNKWYTFEGYIAEEHTSNKFMCIRLRQRTPIISFNDIKLKQLTITGYFDYPF